MLDTIKRRLHRFTYWQWALSGIALLLVPSLAWSWKWHRGTVAIKRLLTSDAVHVTRLQFSIPKWQREMLPKQSFPYTVASIDFDVAWRENDFKFAEELQHVPGLRSLCIGPNPRFCMEINGRIRRPEPDARWNNFLIAIGQLGRLQELDVSCTSTTNAGLESIAALSELRSLNLRGTYVTNARPLSRLRQLRALSLGCDNLDDAALAEFAVFPKLETLDLDKSNTTDQKLGLLGTCEKLQKLVLDRNQITDAGLRHLKRLPTLSHLSLAETSITDAGIRELDELSNLRSLDLSNCSITDDGVHVLAGFRKLEELNLYDTRVTDAALVHLIGLANLECLFVNSTDVSAEGLTRFKQARPNVRLDRPAD